jgi:hypothetical protein
LAELQRASGANLSKLERTSSVGFYATGDYKIAHMDADIN